MRIKCLFGQHKETYEGEHAPELLVSWDEFSLEEAPERFQKECQDKMYDLQEDYIAFGIIDIEVDQDKIRSLLLDVPSIKGTIIH